LYLNSNVGSEIAFALIMLSELRELELKYLRGRKYLDALCVYFWATTPVLISIFTFVTYVLLGNKLTAATVSLILGACILLHVWNQGEGFPPTQLYFNSFFTILFNLGATCFGRMTIFKQKYIHQNLMQLTTDQTTCCN
jgi:hypothetical protein